jgi:hypothetical protein
MPTAVATACASPTQSAYPQWVDELIGTFEDAPVGNPPQSIWRYEYAGQVVCFVPAHCCDMFGTLYDAEGNILCAPDGGLNGRGGGLMSGPFAGEAEALDTACRALGGATCCFEVTLPRI